MTSVSTNASFPLPDPSFFEDVLCLYCGSDARQPFVTAQEDLTGKPGDFTFVQCKDCSLVYQHPRIDIEHIKAYYDDEYIAHRKHSNWGPLAWFFEWIMDSLDRKKDAIVRRHVELGPHSQVLDVGCGVGTFLAKMHKRYGSINTGVDFIDLRGAPELHTVEFHCGPLYEQDLGTARFDLITMWHFLEHDYDPLRTLRHAHHALKDNGRLVIEVPRPDSDDPLLIVGNPIKMSRVQEGPVASWPKLGEHTDDFLREELALDDEALHGLRDSGAIGGG